MCRAARLALVLLIKYHAIRTTMPTMTICQTIALNSGSDQDKRIRFLGAVLALINRGSTTASDIGRWLPRSVSLGLSGQGRPRRRRRVSVHVQSFAVKAHKGQSA